MKTLLAGFIFSILTLSGASVAVAQMAPQAPPCGQNQPRVTPPEQQIYDRTMRRFEPLGLSPQQQGQIQAMIAQYSQAHPAGSPLDGESMRQLRGSIYQVLTPQQFDMLRQENEQRASEGGGTPRHQRCQ